LAVGSLVGLVVGCVTWAFVTWQAAPLLGWDAAACVFLGWTWRVIGGLDADTTATIAVEDDPSAPVAHAVIIAAGIASLGAVGLVLVRAGQSPGVAKALLVTVGVASVGLSWASVHTVFSLRHARLHYGAEAGGVDFHDGGSPAYGDFAPMAFTIGMTFQVSETDLTATSLRRTALRHALLSFLFGAVILALTIDVVASLLH